MFLRESLTYVREGDRQSHHTQKHVVCGKNILQTKCSKFDRVRSFLW